MVQKIKKSNISADDNRRINRLMGNLKYSQLRKDKGEITPEYYSILESEVNERIREIKAGLKPLNERWEK